MCYPCRQFITPFPIVVVDEGAVDDNFPDEDIIINIITMVWQSEGCIMMELPTIENMLLMYFSYFSSR